MCLFVCNFVCVVVLMCLIDRACDSLVGVLVL